jgi:hypothetical protein
MVGRDSVAFTDSGTYWTLVRQSPEGEGPPSRGCPVGFSLSARDDTDDASRECRGWTRAVRYSY